ncbi:MAG: hypothetical protein ACOH1Y_16000 [Propionicimonas sp.]
MTTRSTRPTRMVALRRRLSALATNQVSEVRSAVAGLGRLQATLLLLGALTVAYGGLQMLQLLIERTAPVLGVAGWWLGGPLIVDLIAVPIVVVTGVAIGRVVPLRWRRDVSVASALTVMITLVALPFLTGLGRRTDNPSLLDRNYWAGYLALVAVAWGVPLLAHLARRRPLRRVDHG